MFASLGQSFLNIIDTTLDTIAPLPEDEADERSSLHEEEEEGEEGKEAAAGERRGDYGEARAPSVLEAQSERVPDSAELNDLTEVSLDDPPPRRAILDSPPRAPQSAPLFDRRLLSGDVSIPRPESAPRLAELVPALALMAPPEHPSRSPATEQRRHEPIPVVSDPIDYRALYFESQTHLQQSEEALRESEEHHWRAKAEAGEMLFALEQEQRARAEAACRLAELERERARTLELEHLQSGGRDSQGRVDEAAALERAISAMFARVLGDAAPPQDALTCLARMEAAVSDLTHERSLRSQEAAALETRLMNALSSWSRREAELVVLHESQLAGAVDAAAAEGRRARTLEQQLSDLSGECAELRLQVADLSRAQQEAQAMRGSPDDGQQEQSQLELHQLRLELAELRSSVQRLVSEKAELEIASDAAAGELARARQSLSKSEVEARQLHQVIVQLRQGRRALKAEEDDAVAERDALREQVFALTLELQTLRECSVESADSEARVEALSSELVETRRRCASLESQLDAAVQSVAVLERASYDSGTAAENLRVDAMVARRELQQKAAELSNLHAALLAFERDSSAAQRKTNEVWRQRQDDLRAEFDQQLEATVREWEARLKAQEQLTQAQEQRVREEEVARRKLLQDAGAERQRMQQTMQTALKQLQNSQDDVVDRALVANLLSSYLGRRRPREVLQVLSKILSFSDAQMVEVGLKVAPTNLVDSFINAIAPRVDKVEVHGENLAEMWVNFLLEESGSSDVSKPPLTASLSDASVAMVPLTKTSSDGAVSASSSTSEVLSNFETPKKMK